MFKIYIYILNKGQSGIDIFRLSRLQNDIFSFETKTGNKIRLAFSSENYFVGIA